MNDKNMLEKEREILKKEEEVLAEEKKVLAEEKAVLSKMRKNGGKLLIAAGLIVGAGIAGMLYVRTAGARVSIDKAQIDAPSIALAPQTAGVLEETFVQPGDVVPANTVVARVGNELVKTKIDGLIISINADVGKLFNRGEAVATMVDPGALRVVARVAEDKGLKDIRVGQAASFTVDAFGTRQFAGTVDEVSPAARSSGIVFNISDKRETQEFEVKIRYDVSAYPELKPGMSAKAVIYKD